jgi:hypothetical protein
MEYEVVFDLLQVGYRTWTFAAVGLVFVAIGILIFRWERSSAFSKNYPRFSKVFRYYFLGFSILWTSTAFIFTLSDYIKLRNALVQGKANVVEGQVTDFVPVQEHAMESFKVNGHLFQYSDSVVTSGFNTTNASSGPFRIRNGLQVRVTFVGETIVRLEVPK